VFRAEILRCADFGWGLVLKRTTAGKALTVAAAIFAMATAAHAEVPDFNIPALPLADAIAVLSEQANVPILAPAGLVSDKRSSPVRGRLSTQAAMDQMLKGAGLAVHQEASGVFIITRMLAMREAPVGAGVAEETVTVYGTISGGLARALDIKQSAGSITDAMVAADIGKLPAVNAAEALQHLVGVTVSREAGEGEFIGVRGLGPNFQSVTFNGVPLAVNENVRNSDQSGRQFRFRVLPADLIGAIVVTKAPTADLIDGGIGANIDIKTLRPLQCEPFLAFRAYASSDVRVGSVSPNGSLSVCWKSPDAHFGFTGGISIQRREAQFDRFQNFGYAARKVDGVDAVQVPDGWTTTVEQERRERFSLSAGAQWRPNANFDLHTDILYSRFDNEIAENRVSYELGGFVTTSLVPSSARIKDDVLYAGEILGGRIDRSAEFSAQVHDNLALSAGADWLLRDFLLSATLSLSRANSKLKTPLQRIDSQIDDIPGLRYSFDLGRDPAGAGYIQSLHTNLDLTDPAATQFTRYRIRPTNSRDRDATALLDLSRPLDMVFAGLDLTELRFGGQWTGRYRDYQRRDRLLTPRPGVVVDASFFTGAVPQSAMEHIIRKARSTWIGPDFETFAGAFVVPGEYDGVASQVEDLTPSAVDQRQSYRVEEEVRALYARLDFAGSTGNVPLRGNVGLRWVYTGTKVFGARVFARSNGQGDMEMASEARVTESSYTEFLPSLNLKWELSEALALRLAGSRSMTRPSLASLRDATVPSSATTTEIFERGTAALANPDLDYTAVGGNPKLAPIASWNGDASLERYFDSFGAVTLSAFYKRMSNFIAGDVSHEHMPFDVRSGGTLDLDIAVNRPQNIGDAALVGLELGYSGRLQSGFGLALSAMLTSYDVRLHLTDGTTKTGSLQGVSRTAFSITPFFDCGIFDAYLSYTYRSKFDSNANVTIASTVETDPNETAVAAGFATLDFGAALRLGGALEIFAEGVNIANQHQTAYLGRAARLYQIHDYGRSFNLGVRGRF
jgi:TonB-dependent receptor